MNEQIDWGKAPADATHWQPENAQLMAAWVKMEQGFYWIQMPHMTNWIQYKGPVSHLGELVPRRATWNGPEDGLPPVGMTVEWCFSSNDGWQEIKILGYDGCDAWIKPKGRSSTIVGNLLNLRPIRTAEQLAAEERKAVIRKMELASGSHVGSAITRVICERLYDAGARMPGEGSKA